MSQAYTYILDVSNIIYRAGDYSSLDIELKPMKTGKGHQQAVSTAKKENHKRGKIINFKSFKMCERFMAVLDNEGRKKYKVPLSSYIMYSSSVPDTFEVEI